MSPTLEHDEIVVLLKTKDFDRGDLVGFYYQGKILLKRVIALPEDEVAIDAEKGLIMVKGGVPGAENAWVRVTDALKKTAKVQLPMPAGLKKVDEPVAVKAEEVASEENA